MSVAKTLLSGSVLALFIGIEATLSGLSGAKAQSNYYWGTASVGEPVEVDLQALESLGPEPNLPQLLNPTQPGTELKAPEPRQIAPRAQPRSSLVEQPLATSTADHPISASIAMPKSSLVSTSTETAKQPPKPAQTKSVETKLTILKQPQSAFIDKQPETSSSQTKPIAKPAQVPSKSEIADEPVKKPETGTPPKLIKVEEPVKPEPETEPPALATAEESAPAADPAPTEEETQIAAIDPNLVFETDNTLSIKFPEGVSDLPAGVKPALDKLATRMENDEELRVQLLGYAAAAGDSPSQARRMSLFRALSVRTYLMKKGVRSTRVDVRALGSKVEVGTPDRVDIVIPE